jgi:hypothetical protein
MKLQFAFPDCNATVIHVVFESSRVSVLKGLENMIYELLHAGWGIGWAKGHYSQSVESFSHLKGHEIFCFLTISNIPVAIAEIKFANESHSQHLFYSMQGRGKTSLTVIVFIF